MDDRVKELLERVRGTALAVGEAAGVTARCAGKCAGQMLDTAKLNMKIFDLKGDIDRTCRPSERWCMTPTGARRPIMPPWTPCWPALTKSPPLLRACGSGWLCCAAARPAHPAERCADRKTSIAETAAPRSDARPPAGRKLPPGL